MATSAVMNPQDLPNHNAKTVSLTFHLYPRHHKEFIEICERLEKFHSEVLRELVIDFIKKHKGQSQPPVIRDDFEEEIEAEENKKLKVAY